MMYSGRRWQWLAGGLLCLAMAPLQAALPVFTSIPPQAWLLEQLGGERLQVENMLSANANPHNYDPSPRQLVALANARLYFTIGIPFEAMWRNRLASANTDMEFVHCGTDSEHHHDHEHDEHSDPHIWTDPIEAAAIAACMRDALVRHDPAGKAVYNVNLERLQSELRQLDRAIQQLLADVKPRIILVQHPAWDHFASRYEFEQIAIEDEGHEPNARHLVQVIEHARELGLKKIFIQRQYGPAAARLVADAIGGHVIEMEPMAADYPANLRRLAQALAEH